MYKCCSIRTRCCKRSRIPSNRAAPAVPPSRGGSAALPRGCRRRRAGRAAPAQPGEGAERSGAERPPAIRARPPGLGRAGGGSGRGTGDPGAMPRETGRGGRFLFVNHSGMERSKWDTVLVPILSNKENHASWPGCVSQDMEHHVEIMKNKTQIMKGLMSGRTHLPIPMVAAKTDLHQIYAENRQDRNSRAVLHAIESVVIRWSHQIHDTVNRDSAEPLLHGLHPDPQTELNFWKARKDNLLYINKQLQRPVVQKMIKILKAKESSHYSASQDIFKEVEDGKALVEAQDIDLYLRPLEKYIQVFREMEFPKICNLIPPLFHTICLIWSHSEFYSMPAQIVVLLQAFCNLLIDQSRLYLSPENLFKGETEEALERVKIAKTALKSFKDLFFSHRNRLESYFTCGKEFKPWDFRSEMLFSRFDMFLNCLLTIEEIFINKLEFQKLEKLEFGGIKGKILSEQVCRMSEEFLESFGFAACWLEHSAAFGAGSGPSAQDASRVCTGQPRVGRRTEPPGECPSRWAAPPAACCSTWQGWQNGSRIRSRLPFYPAALWSRLLFGSEELLTIFGSFLKKPVIMDILSPDCKILLEMFYEELDNCRHICDEHIKKVCHNAKIKDYVLVGSQWLNFCSKKQAEEGNEITNKNIPVASGNLKWDKELKEQIQTFWSYFSSLPYLVLESPGAVFISQKYVEMLKFLDQYEDQTYCGWKVQVDEICQFNLSVILIKCNPENGLLSVNFDPELVALLREVKYLLMLNQPSIPDFALAIYEKRNSFAKCIGNHLVVQLYNRLMQTTLEVAYPLIENELRTIDDQLKEAEEICTWQATTCWDCIKQMKTSVCDLEQRVQQSKDNVRSIQGIMNAWMEHALFFRKGKKEALLYLDDKGERLAKIYKVLQENSYQIHHLVEGNLKLFKADSSSASWRIYMEYVDDIVVDGLYNTIMGSLDFFLDNTEELKPAPLFQAQMILNGTEIQFKPSLDKEAGDGFYDLVDLLGDVFMSAQVKRVAAHLGSEHYQNDMGNMFDLSEIRQEIMERVANVTSKALEYRRSPASYASLWLEDQSEFMKQFLLHGHGLASTKMPLADEVFQQPPTIKLFKEQIDIYEKLCVQISKLEDSKIFESWFKVDTNPFKMSLLNIIKKWSRMFKEYLLRFVIVSLTDLEEFIKVTDAGLQREVTKGDYCVLVETMGHLLAVKQATADELSESLKEMVPLLESYGQKMPHKVYAQLEELPEKWNAIKKRPVLVKHKEKQMEFRERFKMEAPFQLDAENAYAHLDKANQELEMLEKEMLLMQESAKLFEVAIPDYKQMKQCRKVRLLKKVDISVYINSGIDDWAKTQWRQINVEQMDVELGRFAKEMRYLDKAVRSWDVYMGLELKVKNLMSSLRAILELQNPALRDRHWYQVMNVTGAIAEDPTLTDLLGLQLHKVEDEVQSIVDKAVKELGAEKCYYYSSCSQILAEISQTWAAMEFSYEEHHRNEVPLLKSDEQLLETLDNNQVQLQTILRKYVVYFIEQVKGWQNKLSMADSVIYIWMEVERMWSHLESIFMSSEDIRSQLPEDANRFDEINRDLKELVTDIANTKNVMEATTKPKVYEKFEALWHRLSLCEKALAEYLETKRIAFPRFYFVSSADFLDILSRTQPKKVAHHSKLFNNIADVKFQENIEESVNTALGMYSREKEYVEGYGCSGQVESWLQCLEETGHKTVRFCILEAILADEEKQREQWVFDYPAQVALTGSQIWWISDVEMAFSRLEEGLASALKDCHKKKVTQLNAVITVLLRELSSGDQKIMTICTIDVHARDVVASLVAQKFTSSAFAWLSQLRHRWDDAQKHCFANICDAQFQYFYEYLRNTPRLVITPLTDRCYITLAQSLHLIVSGAPAGPAGTGRTETTRDLGRVLGVMVYIFNCSEQMDYKSIGNIYKGLVQTGAWGCFHEFNRISVEVLSVVAVQVKTIHDATRNKKKKFLFLGENITLKSSVGIFITMSPGYAGRTELPENVKALFRPCATVVRDIELISEIMLVAEGFIDACLLARNFITLYTLCRELLSKQDHYDWGFHAIKSVLVVAGSLKQGDKNRSEDQALMRALRDFNLPKIVTDDIPIFMGLISDLFPALDVPRKRNLQFEQMVKQSTLELRLQPEESFILKVVQLEELLAARHSITFVIGNAGTGKSKMLKVLHHTYVNMKQKPVWNGLNPKVLTADELFGFIHEATEWKDGLLSSLLREANITHEGPKCLVLDIDPMWIVFLNIVMDDNTVLTLTSNERVPVTPSMWLLFEVHHLRAATPATVSRAGILYLNTQYMGWHPYVASWIETWRYQSEKVNLTVLFDKYVPPYLEQLRTRFKTLTPIPENSMVQTLCSLLDCLLTSENVSMDCPRELYEMYFVFACIWAFGRALSQDQLSNYQAEFSCWWLKKMKAVKFPSYGTVFDYYLDLETRKFLPWVDKVLSPDVDPAAPLQAIFAHASETTRLKYFVDLLLTKSKPVMLVGNAGVGKTAFVGDRLAALSEDYLLANIPLNYYTTSAVLQKMLEKEREKAGHNYGPVGNKKLIYFMDDLNMPEVDRYGTVQPHALIRQHIDGHWYDRQKLTIKEIHIACMNPSAGSFAISPRLQRHFAVFALNFPSSDSHYSKIVCFHFQQHAFTPSVIKNIPAIVQATIWLNQVVVQNFPPAAVKFHYIFNMRDLSNVFQGLFATPECLQQPKDLQCLWLHESARVYGDKLVENKDCSFFHKLMMDTVHKYFEVCMNVEDQVLLQSPLIYCHFANGRADPCYKPVKGWELLRNILEEFLESYNEMHASMNLVLFEGAMQHVQISCILEAPRGYALLIGVGGRGKQSLSRLAAYICSLEVFQITLKKDYGIQDLRVDLASLYIKTGAKNLPTVFLLTDAQVPDERFLVLINDLLASGEVPDLFSDEDMEGIVTGVRKEVQALGLMDTRESCWRFFLSRVWLQLKIVLRFSPAGAMLQARARKFPAIVNCTAIDWFHEWPREALRSISRRFIEEAEGVEPLIQDSICDFMAYVHTSVNMLSAKYNCNERQNYTTLKSFLEQIVLYKILLEKKSNEMSEHMEHLVNGMQKLKAAASQVEDLKSKLASQEAELQLRNQDAEALIAKIGFQTEKVSQEKAIADAEEQKVSLIPPFTYLRRKECEDDLLKAKPALVAATAALDVLNKVNLTELKAFINPPVAVTNVIAAVMALLAYKGKVPKDQSWNATKVFMGKVDDFLQALINYEKEHIPQNCLKVVKEHYLKDPDFNPNYVHTKYFAAAGLCAWVFDIVKFNEVYCEVEPKRCALAQANAELAAATEKLEAIRKKLLVLDSNLRKLTASLEKAVAEKVRCQDDVDRTNKTIGLANRLVKGLESENRRWNQSVENLKVQKKTLCGDVLLTAAFVSYFGPFTKQYHQELMEHFWIPFLKSQTVPIPETEGLDPIATLTDDAMIAAWSNEGLAGDRMSTENATILTNCKRWPLMIDPQQQGLKWIKNKYGADLKVVHLGQKGFLKTIETALAWGETVLIKSMGESIDPILDPLLGSHTVKIENKYIKIEDKECEFTKNFCLILHTKLANPHYKPELQAQTTLINFTVTRDGLEDQLLAELVSAERPDLEKCKSIRAKQQSRFKTELRQLKDDMLLSLSAAQGSFLDNSELVEKLEYKSTPAEIQHEIITIAEAKENEAQINVTREHYRPTAIRASILYFVSNSLDNINPIYQFSLKAFNAVFHKAIQQAEKSGDSHISNLTEAVTYSTFLFTSQGLFERDKLIFLAQTAFQLLLRSKEIELLELDFLLRFRVEHTYKSPVDFLTTQSWSAIRAMAVMDVFRGDIEGSTKRWKKWVDSECPEKEKLPQEWTNKSSLQKLVILRALCPDRMTYALRNFVEEKLGSRYVESTRMDLAKSYEESSPATPVFFILSPGVDPLEDIETLGKKLGFTIDSGRFHHISLGQGQEMVAEEALEKAARHGHWVLLQNIHLVAKWLQTLEKLLKQYSEESHPDFHVFISAEAAPTPEEHIIPQGILENSIKITNEPPTGMLANLHAALYSFNQDTLEPCTREGELKSILFSLCYFHACIAGRLKGGPQGWNGRYPFSTRDLAICITVPCNYDTRTKVPWEDLHYLFGEIMYGGHITDAWDRRLCCIYLQEFTCGKNFHTCLKLLNMYMTPDKFLKLCRCRRMFRELVTALSIPLLILLLKLEGELTLAPGFLVPVNLDYAGYHKYIDEVLPSESPVLYGLHPNAEMGYLTAMSDHLFKTLLEMQPMNSFVGEGSGQSAEEKVKNVLDSILGMLPEEFNMADMQKTTAWSPYALVCLQECERINLLFSEIRRSLKQLDLGLKGKLVFSPHMEVLQSALFYDAVPDTWTKLAYPSRHSLAPCLLMYGELEIWTQDLVLPAVVWLPGLFNPQSFLTAVMQSRARKNNWPLDKVCLTVDVTKKTEDYGHPPREGACICGLFMESARDIQLGTIAEARLKELTPAMPVIFVRTILVDQRESPVYKTKSRGPTYIWTFNLKSQEKLAKWILARVALLLAV
ncbi:LOW QUALITY PROTEIN: dynein axonemal heavy chain 11 [Ciconia maguari]